MTTVTIQIGNTDDKLTQREWSDFVVRVGSAIEGQGIDTHFSGVSHGAARWQNACWVFEIPDGLIDELKDRLKKIRSEFRQESIALTEGHTVFI